MLHDNNTENGKETPVLHQVLRGWTVWVSMHLLDGRLLPVDLN